MISIFFRSACGERKLCDNEVLLRGKKSYRNSVVWGPIQISKEFVLRVILLREYCTGLFINKKLIHIIRGIKSCAHISNQRIKLCVTNLYLVKKY